MEAEEAVAASVARRRAAAYENAALSLASDPVDDDAVRQFVNENGNLEQFEKNRVLIQMENVPDDLLDKIVIEEYTDSL